MINLLNPGGNKSDFNPIPIQKIIRQYLRSEADMATVFVQAALADRNHNRTFDTAEEYSDFIDRMEKNRDTSYKNIDFSALKPDIDYSSYI